MEIIALLKSLERFLLCTCSGWELLLVGAVGFKWATELLPALLSKHLPINLRHLPACRSVRAMMCLGDVTGTAATFTCSVATSTRLVLYQQAASSSRCAAADGWTSHLSYMQHLSCWVLTPRQQTAVFIAANLIKAGSNQSY